MGFSLPRSLVSMVIVCCSACGASQGDEDQGASATQEAQDQEACSNEECAEAVGNDSTAVRRYPAFGAGPFWGPFYGGPVGGGWGGYGGSIPWSVGRGPGLGGVPGLGYIPGGWGGWGGRW